MWSKVGWVGIGIVAVVVAASVVSLAYTKVRPKIIERSVTIDATAEQVWSVLTDTAAYPQWNPFIVSSTGDIAVGSTLTNTLRNNGSDMVFSPTVLVAQKDRELRWIGRFGVPGVVDGEHWFRIEPLADGGVRFTQGERFTGFLVPVAGSSLDVDDGFGAMNDALAQRVSEVSGRAAGS